MCDQDHDGSHIKGLVLNLFHVFWPSLLEHGFVEEFITPIVKVTDRASKQVHVFFTLAEYRHWMQTHGVKPSVCTALCVSPKRESLVVLRKEVGVPNSITSPVLPHFLQPLPPTQLLHVKYYKGLGTNTAAEGKEYFRNLAQHRIAFQWKGPQDADALELAFKRSRADDRKVWLNDLLGNGHSTESAVQDLSLVVKPTAEAEGQGFCRTLTVSDFVHKELILFSHADNVRNIPSLVDGLKVSVSPQVVFSRRLSSFLVREPGVGVVMLLFIVIPPAAWTAKSFVHVPEARWQQGDQGGSIGGSCC